ncbi:hypothetical protein AU106_gp152 [Sinorhizobium phage phiM9]|uniref:DUF7831 domain-containing protein n=1 Tax=Sinorhizobium phage phiM9 TaxID=1636182 RepID=A0A0F6R7L8_9CAUD|nr:hypothetical protein AU106_gp152 [Sinorhizobium phage phiM9]AKE44783.1 hypothetical protein Sm_phiM9_155 [Sinorhizobium phage phiM9]
MPLEYRKFITRQMLKDEPDTLFVFGDNLSRVGLGGQAKEMRGEPNAVGIPTKKLPLMADHAFFTDDDYFLVLDQLLEADKRIVEHLNSGGTVVWPEDGIGTGLAQLDERAPMIAQKIAFMQYLYEYAFPPKLDVF